MFNKYIEQLHPHPVLNMEWYKGTDDYSEGDIEDTIVKLIAENEPEEYSKIICDNYNWSVFYHLTKIRQNILNWYPFEENADVLEIGCGMGAITGMLCDRCASVTSVELSRRRAIATLLRCREKDNLEVIVGNINDIEFHKKFDYITLIGVLEYQGSYTDSVDPYADFLKKIKTLLKPNGKLLIGIENQYGLKYWCGAKEDHTGLPFDGMNQYTLSNRKVRTFSKKALELLLKKCGFSNSYFYYPMPDYKLPTTVYSENYLPEDENMQNVRYYYAKNAHTLVANEKDMYKDLIENHVFDFFSNSFLVECAGREDLGNILFASLCDERQKEYQLGTKIYRNKVVKKFSLSQTGGLHIKQTVANEKALKDRGLLTLGSKIVGDELETPYHEGELLEKLFVKACRAGDEEQAIYLLERLYADILLSSEIAPDEDNILYVLHPELRREQINYGPILKNGYLDMTFRNAFVSNENLIWFDQEWMLENVPADYIIYRALGTVYFSYQDINDKIPMERIIEKCGLKASWEGFKEIEKLFSTSIRDELHITEGAGFTQVDSEGIIENIKKVM